jgi:hypothetical protein
MNSLGSIGCSMGAQASRGIKNFRTLGRLPANKSKIYSNVGRMTPPVMISLSPTNDAG